MLDPVTHVPGPAVSGAYSRRDTAQAAVLDAVPDLLLVERARGGEGRAAEALIRRYGRRLYRVARSLISDTEAAELAVEEACLIAFGSLNSQIGAGRFAAWLTRLVFNRARAQRAAVRSEPRVNSVPPGSAPAEAAGLPPQQELERALSALPEVFRTVFVLRVLEGTSSVDTAASLGVHETTVRTRLYRAQRRLGPELTGRLRGAAPELLAPGSERLDRLVTRVVGQLPHGSMLTISASPP